MSSLAISSLRSRAKLVSGRRRIVLPEWKDSRVLHAASDCNSLGLAEIVLLGNKESIWSLANQYGVKSLSGIRVFDANKEDDLIDGFSEKLFKRRGGKDLKSLDVARLKILSNPLYLGNSLLAGGLVDGQVSGSISTTADVVRSALHCLGTARGISTVSSFMIMARDSDAFIFTDPALVVAPSPEQLADIALSAADSCRNVLNLEPIVAMLSFSTRDSASHMLVDRVKEAVEIVKRKNPDLVVDGEMQFDAAWDVEVASRKAPGSKVGGRANVFVFPDLNSGNIGYKIAERLGGFQAVGPIMQGFAKPSNDLSRGCQVKDIVDSVAVTVLQAQNNEAVLKECNFDIFS